VECLQSKLKNVARDPMNRDEAYDVSTGRSFFYDKNQGWRDAKTGEEVCPKKRASKDAVYESYLYVQCLQSKLKNVARDPMNRDDAYDVSTGRSFFYDKKTQTWRDAKTGECICPKCAEQPKRTVPPQAPPSPPPEQTEWEKRFSCLKAKFPRVKLHLEPRGMYVGMASDLESHREFRWDN